MNNEPIAKWKAKEDILFIDEQIDEGVYGFSEITARTIFRQGDVMLEFENDVFKEELNPSIVWSFHRDALERLFTKVWINHEVN